MTTQLTQINQTEIVEKTERELYLELKAFWSEKVATGEPNAVEHLRYILNRSRLRKNGTTDDYLLYELKTAFGPVKNTVKLHNGRSQYDTLISLLYNEKWTNKEHADLAGRMINELR